MVKHHRDDQDKTSDRRDFLKLASVGAVIGGASLVIGSPAKADEQSGKKETGYHKTQHIQTYYDLSRF